MATGKPGFVEELKRRHVWRVAVAYAVAGWLIVQIATQVFPFFRIPAWGVRLVIVLIVIGFPVAVVFAWIYELTPEGIRRTAPADSPDARSAPVSRQIGRKLNAVIVATLVLAVALLAWRLLVVRHAAPPIKPAESASGHTSGRASASPGAAASPSTSVHATQREAPSPIAAQPIPAKSIAVLPFINMSGDPSKAYFSDGITEEILNALAQIPHLKVAARTSAFAFKGKAENLHKVGSVLGVATVLEGSVQTAGDDVRITVQLIDVRSGYQLWSQKYDRKLNNIFAVEDEISKAIADKLQVSLSGGAGQSLVVQRTVDPRAHDFYLRGLTLLAARSMRDALDAFQQAVKIDPDYAPAWGALSETEALLPANRLDSVTAALPRAQSAAQRALALDPDTASAYVTLGIVHSIRWQWPEADQAFRRALAVAPGDSEAVDQYAQFLEAVGQLEPALREIERAQQLDPLSAVIGTIRASILGALQRYRAAEAQLQRTLAAHPDSALANGIAAWMAFDQRHYAEAEAQIRIWARLVRRDPEAAAKLVRSMADPSQRAAEVKLLETSPAYAGLRAEPVQFATFLMRLGDRARALAALESNGVHTRDAQPRGLWNPVFDPIRNDPRFKAVQKRMHLPYKPPAVPTK